MDIRHADTMLVQPALALCAELGSPGMRSDEARVMMIAIGLQESRFEHRAQIKGPARGFWQFERGGGTRGVMRYQSTAGYARAIATELCYDVTGSLRRRTRVVHKSLADNGLLAACMARLLLWTDPHALPSLDDPQGAWALYLRVWRPGKPHRHTWDMLHAQAVRQVRKAPL